MSPDANMPEWVLHARKFIATGKKEFLSEAIQSCTDTAIGQLLSCRELAENMQVPPEKYGQLGKSLEEAGRMVEAVIVKLLGLRSVAIVAASPERLSRKISQFCENVCNEAANISHEAGFKECEAGFARTLGTREAKLHKWQRAAALLSHSLNIYRNLSKKKQNTYNPNIAANLNNLGNVFLEMRQFTEARNAYEEALNIRRKLAKTEPEIYRPHVAATLNNLGNALDRMQHFTQAMKANEEALEIYRDLAKRDSKIYRPHVAITLNNLGSVLRDLRQFTQSINAYQEALEIRRSLAEGEPEIYRPDVAITLNNIGNVLVQMRQLTQARNAYEEALEIRRELAKKQPRIYRPDMAMTLSNISYTLDTMRQFALSREACKEALEIYRILAKIQPKIYRPNVATVLNNLGNVLRNMQQYTEAKHAYEEALEISNDLFENEPEIYRRYTAMTLNNLGNVLRDMRQLPLASDAYQEALEIYRKLADNEPSIYELDVAMALNNLGNVFGEMQQFADAQNSYKKALDIYHNLAGKELQIHKHDVAIILNNLAKVLIELCQNVAAIKASQQAIQAAETANTINDTHYHLTKGAVLASYEIILAYLTKQSATEDIFRCLASMRDRSVLATSSTPEHGLSRAAEQIKRIEKYLGQEAKLLIVENLPQGGLCLAALGGNAPNLEVFSGESFRQKAEMLFDEIQAAFSGNDSKNPSEQNALIRQLATDAWLALPSDIRNILVSEDQYVLISGNAYWTMFPWEALCIGAGQSDFLGLRRTLPRWSPLTGDALARLRRTNFGNAERTAAVIAPWDTYILRPLYGTAIEAIRANESLNNLGYELRPGGRPWLGTAATNEAMDTILGDPPSIIHFTGHGGIDANEEIVLLWDNLREYEIFRYGRMQLELLKAARNTPGEKLLANGPLVVLNSCLTGRMREHGGQREDLASTLISEGATTVIATALPIYDNVGLELGTKLYEQQSKEIGQAVLDLRRHLAETICNENSRLWPAWMMITCHGNPHAYMPHHAQNN